MSASDPVGATGRKKEASTASIDVLRGMVELGEVGRAALRRPQQHEIGLRRRDLPEARRVVREEPEAVRRGRSRKGRRREAELGRQPREAGECRRMSADPCRPFRTGSPLGCFGPESGRLVQSADVVSKRDLP